MNITAALDVATGLILMYLLLSLFCTTINEFISGFCSLRARTLRTAMHQLIDDPRLKTLFYNHGLIDSTKIASGATKNTSPTVNAAALPADGTAPAPIAAPATSASIWSWLPWKVNHPSYLAGSTVASAMVGTLLGYVDPTKPLPLDATIADLRTAVSKLPVSSNIRDVLSGCLVEAGTSVDDFRDNVAKWFDDAMERLSGSYKRFVQIISFVVCVVVAYAFNADTLDVTNHLWRDQTLSNVIAQSASGLANSAGLASIGTTLSKQQLQQAGCADVSQKPASSTAAATPDLASSIDKMCVLNAELRPLPIGWTMPFPWALSFWKAIGLLATAIALTLGAPFWFDLLQKFVNIRMTGTKPASSTQPS